MSDVTNIRDYLKQRAEGQVEVRFCSAAYHGQNGQIQSFIFSRKVKDLKGTKDLMNQFLQEGGIGDVCEDGVYRWMPWPCAVIEIRDV
jgi:hypothetical protein